MFVGHVHAFVLDQTQVLFELRCDVLGDNMGGVSWHYLVCNVSTEKVSQTESIRVNITVVNVNHTIYNGLISI